MKTRIGLYPKIQKMCPLCYEGKVLGSEKKFHTQFCRGSAFYADLPRESVKS